MQSVGLVLAGFLIGVIVSNFGRGTDTPVTGTQWQNSRTAAYPSEYTVVSQTEVWDVLAGNSGDGRTIALGQEGFVRVVVQDDQSALYILTYKPGDDVWQGRLMDVGNDGTVEVADLSYGHCEAFTPR